MAIRAPHRAKIEFLLQQYLRLSKGQEDLIEHIKESEVAESIFNSNAIENSTLSLIQTEQIVFDSQVAKGLELREVLEAKNLLQVIRLDPELNMDSLLRAHGILLSGIDDDAAGRFRKKGESVRIANHIAPKAESIPALMDDLVLKYHSNTQDHFLEKIARFHLDFELIHPFCDGNGRMGRMLINWQLQAHDCPPVIIRNSEKKKYYSAFREFKAKGKSPVFEKMLTLALIESFHKRLAFLKGLSVVTLAQWVRSQKASPSSVNNAAKRQSIPAFRQNEVWMIGV